MHRTYEATNAPIRVSWFNDRIEVLSPGGAFGVVTAAKTSVNPDLPIIVTPIWRKR